MPSGLSRTAVCTFLKLATLNVGRGGGAYCAPINDFFQEHGLDALCLQEVDLNPPSVLSFQTFWQAKGFYVSVSPSVEGIARAAIVSTVPMQPCTLSGHTQRCACALLEVRFSQSYRKIALVSFYGFHGDSPRTQAMLHDTLQGVSGLGLDFIVMGDFQFQVFEHPIAPTLAAGLCYCMDDCRTTHAPATGPGGRRVIDFGLCSFGIHTASALTCCGTADHQSVHYVVPMDGPTRVTVAKCWPAQPCLSEEDALNSFDTAAFESSFASASSVEDMWRALAISADAALFGVPPDQSFRHLPWQPSSFRPVNHKASMCSEPLHIRRGRRLERRLRHACCFGLSRPLWRKVKRDVLDLTTDLPPLSQISLDSPFDCRQALQVVCPAVAAAAEALKQRRLQQWRGNMQASFAKQCRWVKQRASLQLEREAPSPSASQVASRSFHPAVVIQQEHSKWQALWTAVPSLPTLHARVASLLQEVPQAQSASFDLDFSASALRRSMSKMRHKAAGPDGFSAAALLLLPQVWWCGFSALWRRILATGVVPLAWRFNRVALIPKPAGGFRPIGLTAVCWRAGCRLLVRALGPWISSWLLPGDVGGLPGRSAMDAHRLVDFALQRGSRAFVQEDLAKFYDSVHFELVKPLLERLGCPLSALGLLDGFYSSQYRLLSFKGRCSHCWIPASRGLVQGCPASPVIAACVMHFWQLCVSTPGVGSLAYQDDRTLILHPQHDALDFAPLQSATCKSRRFDQAFGFACDPAKSSVVGDCACEPLASALGYQRTTVLSLLGVDHPLDVAQPKLLSRFTVAKVKARMKFIPAVARFAWQATLLLRGLCFSQFLWAAGFAVPSSEQLSEIRACVRATLGRHLTHESPPVLFHEVCDWASHVQFSCDWATLLAAFRFHCRRPVWLEGLCLEDSLRPWYQALPEARPLLARLGWSVSLCGSTLTWRDAANRARSFHFGHDSLSVLREWLLLPHRRAALASCGRVNRSLHRADQSLARGLDLPAPPAGSFLRAEGHRSLWKDSASSFVRRAAIASGGSFWHLAPTFFQSGSRCACGLREPSRAHLTWCCPRMADLRSEVSMPRDRCAERLFARPAVEVPPPPVFLDAEGFVADFADTLDFGQVATLVAVTDGSSRGGVHGVAAGSVVFPTVDKSLAFGVPGEDQSSFKAELFALKVLLQILLLARGPCLRSVHVLVDCESAMTSVTSYGCALPGLAEDVRSLREQLLVCGVAFVMHWVPSHRKRPARWQPWTCIAPEVQQDWNERADACASGKCCELHRLSLRGPWLVQCASAKAWELQAIRLSAAAAERLASA